MDDNSVIQFTDQTVTFEQFVDMLATKVALSKENTRIYG